MPRVKISDLRAEIAKKDLLIARLNEVIEQKDAELARLRERVAQLEKARERHFYIYEKQINDIVNDNDEVD